MTVSLLEESTLLYLVEAIEDALGGLDKRPERLLLVGGASWPVRTQVAKAIAERNDMTYLSLGLPLSQALQDVPENKRPLKVEPAIEALLAARTEHSAIRWVLDHLEVLFLPELRVSAPQLLRRLARTRTIVAIWPGAYQDGWLTYAEPGHPEFIRERFLIHSYICIDHLL